MPDKDSDGAERSSEATSKRLLSRRSYLTAAAGAAAMVAAGGKAAAASEYETITVPEGGHFEVELGDGETFENKLIDISASGATWKVNASGSGWAVRNIGVKGVWDAGVDNAWPLSVRVDEGGTGVIENYYFADGVVDSTYPGVTGIYVYRTHGGTLQIDGVNIQGMAGNAIYASTPGYPADDDPDGSTRPTGHQGVVEITNSFGADCVSSHFRIGSDGSFVKNCVSRGGDRGAWLRFNDTRVIDCDFSGASTNHADGDIVCGTNNWDSGEDATVTVENTVYETTGQDINYAGTINGSSADRELRTSPPAGAPTTPEEAASGATGGSDGSGVSSGDSTGDTTDDSTDAGSSSHTVAIEAGANSGWGRYALTTSGEITRGQAANPSDEITQNGDGSWTVEGVVGNGGVDDYSFEGEVLAWSTEFDASDYTLTLDGSEVSPSELPSGSSGDSTDDSTDSGTSTHTLAVEAAADSGWGRYTLTTSGEITRGSSANGSDEITQNGDGTWTVEGVVGNGGVDDYEFAGSVESWSTELAGDEYALTLDGSEVSPSDLSGGSTDSGPVTHTLAVEAGDNTGWRSYALTTSGEITRGSSANGSDAITQNSDGTWTVEGVVGNGGVDDYEFTGSVESWSTELAGDEYALTLDGSTVSAATLRNV